MCYERQQRQVGQSFHPRITYYNPKSVHQLIAILRPQTKTGIYY